MILRLKDGNPKTTLQVLLCITVKAVNDTLGPEGICAFVLAFGEYLRLNPFISPIKTDRHWQKVLR